MKVLFLHPNMPGQFKHSCRALAENPDNTVVFVTKRDDIEIPGVHRVTYKVRSEPSPHTHRYLTGVARSVLQGQEVWRVCKKLKEEEGFVPDVIVAHPGWGDTMYMKDLFPSAPILNFFEFFYHAEGADVNFAPDEKTTPDDDARIRTKNATNLFALQYCDWGFCPTFWQLKQHPKEYYHRISVIHDGIDTDLLAPNENVKVTTPSGVTLTRKDEVVTYVARNFEPYRGFPTFMRAAEIILKERPNTHILAIGADGVSYGKKLTNG
ncbi:MAG: glycosyl transferase family 1, partial [Alphaproteobacteria bacterium]|nr:glycosyl transferase family 1 [Alphaproteobacteria bacterium]